MILVDDLKHYPHATTREKTWCHMISDSNETELHQFADRLGLRRAWFQNEGRGLRAPLAHYDLTPRRRKRALELGAVAVSSKELVRRHYNRQEPDMIPEPLAKAQCYRESLLKLGFSDDQIKMGFGVEITGFPIPPTMQHVTISLFVTDAAPPTGDFVITCGAIWKSWTPEICMLNWNKTPLEERKRLYTKHQPLPEFAALVGAIRAKGITIPQLPEHLR